MFLRSGSSVLGLGACALRTLARPKTCTPSSPLAAAVSISRRKLHQVPDLHNQETFKLKGIEPLFSQKGFEVAWEKYQKSLVDGLNELVAGTTLENDTALTIALQTARRPELAATFNYASQAHNNHFFFESLTTSDQPPPDAFLDALSPTFSSLSTLKSELLATALALFGSGSVWLVLTLNRRLRILATYNAGTPYPGAISRRQDIDTNTYASPYQHYQGSSAYGYGNDILDSTMSVAAGARVGGGVGGAMHFPVPLLNVSVWPQVYMTDYGVSKEGKRKYLENWWNCIDWVVVAQRYPSLQTTGIRRLQMS